MAPVSMLDEIYQDVILDHYRNPRCAKAISDPDCSACMFNPLCGDKVELAVKVTDNKISDLHFQGHGCAISQACASIMSELCEGRSIDEATKLSRLFKSMLMDDSSPPDLTPLGDASLLAGVKRLPARKRCALLAWETLERCIQDWKGKQN